MTNGNSNDENVEQKDTLTVPPPLSDCDTDKDEEEEG